MVLPTTDYRSPLNDEKSRHAGITGYHDPDEINLLEYIYVLVKHKWWIIGATVAGLLLGYVAALIKGPTWTATAVIAPKESDKGAPNVSGSGVLGGMVSSLLGACGNGVLCPLY